MFTGLPFVPVLVVPCNSRHQLLGFRARFILRFLLEVLSAVAA